MDPKWLQVWDIFVIYMKVFKFFNLKFMSLLLLSLVGAGYVVFSNSGLWPPRALRGTIPARWLAGCMQNERARDSRIQFIQCVCVLLAVLWSNQLDQHFLLILLLFIILVKKRKKSYLKMFNTNLNVFIYLFINFFLNVVIESSFDIVFFVN